jgi:hypothetical protein
MKKLIAKNEALLGALIPVWLSKENQAAIVEICKTDNANLDDVVNFAIQRLWLNFQDEVKRDLLALRKSPSNLVH